MNGVTDHSAVHRMRAVLDLKPTFASAGAIVMIEALRDNPLEGHVARDHEQDITDLALLVLGDEYAVHWIREQSGQGAFAQRWPFYLLGFSQGVPIERSLIASGHERMSSPSAGCLRTLDGLGIAGPVLLSALIRFDVVKRLMI